MKVEEVRHTKELGRVPAFPTHMFHRLFFFFFFPFRSPLLSDKLFSFPQEKKRMAES